MESAFKESVFSIFITPPVPIFVWMTYGLFFAIPIMSLIVFIHAWMKRRHGKEASWQLTLIQLNILIVATLTGIQVSTRMNCFYFVRGIEKIGEAQNALGNLEMAHACGVFTMGILATSFCIALAILSPKRIKI